MVTDTQRGIQLIVEACSLGPWQQAQKPLPLRCDSAGGLHSILNPGFPEVGMCRTGYFQSPKIFAPSAEISSLGQMLARQGSASPQRPSDP